MRFAHTVVSNTGFGYPDHNQHRLALLGELLARLATEQVAFVAIPAGYLTVRTEGDVPTAVAAIAHVVEATGVAVFGGVDVKHTGKGKATKGGGRVMSAGLLPYLGFFARPGSTAATLPVWRQASTNDTNGWTAPESLLPTVDRVFTVRNRKVLPLMCGELFNKRIESSLPALGPDIVLDLGHDRMTRVIRTMKRIAADQGCPVAHTQHLAGWYGRLIQFASPKGKAQPHEMTWDPHIGDEEFWIRWCVRDLAPA